VFLIKYIIQVFVTKDLKKEVKELNKIIRELEKMLSEVIAPLREVRKTTQNYLKITSLILEHGGLTPDMILPELKDRISREIVRVLLDKQKQNISEITELVRIKRGTASRRIIRERLKDLEEKKIVNKQIKGKYYVYNLTDEVIKKWSQMLGFNI
jgi:DNA-binding transcriptional ArsR family regulator